MTRPLTFRFLGAMMMMLSVVTVGLFTAPAAAQKDLLACPVCKSNPCRCPGTKVEPERKCSKCGMWTGGPANFECFCQVQARQEREAAERKRQAEIEEAKRHSEEAKRKRDRELADAQAKRDQAIAQAQRQARAQQEEAERVRKREIDRARRDNEERQDEAARQQRRQIREASDQHESDFHEALSKATSPEQAAFLATLATKKAEQAEAAADQARRIGESGLANELSDAADVQRLLGLEAETKAKSLERTINSPSKALSSASEVIGLGSFGREVRETMPGPPASDLPGRLGNLGSAAAGTATRWLGNPANVYGGIDPVGQAEDNVANLWPENKVNGVLTKPILSILDGIEPYEAMLEDGGRASAPTSAASDGSGLFAPSFQAVPNIDAFLLADEPQKATPRKAAAKDQIGRNEIDDLLRPSSSPSWRSMITFGALDGLLSSPKRDSPPRAEPKKQTRPAIDDLLKP